MNPPKYVYSDRVTLWKCLMGGWVCFHKIKYFNIVTVHGWVSICVMILHYNTTLTPSSKAIYSGTKYYDTHIEFHSLFLDVSSTDV